MRCGQDMRGASPGACHHTSEWLVVCDEANMAIFALREGLAEDETPLSGLHPCRVSIGFAENVDDSAEYGQGITCAGTCKYETG